ncbi:MAG: BTAD domain-containing putative transcriptional regulator [Solirubrobacteraceae bacterium]
MGSDAAARLQFRMLGPLEVTCDGEVLSLGGERQRALLALLLVRANQLVTKERLVDELFAGQPSATALNALRVAVSRLRQTLRTEGVLETKPGGYVLRVPSGELDTKQFEVLCEQARKLIAAGDPAGASDRLREALALWRGPPLADVALIDGVQGEIRRLDELRLSAVLDRIDADLAVGEGVELVGELEALVDAEPFQERLRGQLMRALYRAGRQADALAAYRRMSELMRDELGLEPSRALQGLEQQILLHDPALEVAPREVRQTHDALPAPPTPFLGRRNEIAEVTAMLKDSRVRLLTLTGPGGSGKTRLALRIGELQAARYRDGACFVDFSHVSDPELIAQTICEALGIAEQPSLTPAERLVRWLEKRELLLILDNLEQLAAGAGRLAALLGQCPSLVMLTTSRAPLHLSAEQQYELSGLRDRDATELFITRAHAVAPDANIDAALALDVCDRLDGLPLAIELAAARSKTLSVAELLRRLDQRLPVLTGGPRDAPGRQRTLRATIDWSYELLDQNAQRLFARLAMFTGGCTLAAAEAVCGAQLDVLQSLVDHSLVRSDGERYWMLETIREYARERLELSDEAGQLAAAHADWFTQLLEREGLLAHTPPTRRLHRLLTRESANLRSALAWAAANGEYETMARMAWPLTHYLWIRQGQFDGDERWVELAMVHLDDYPRPIAAGVLGAARSLAWHHGHVEAAVDLSERMLVICRELGDLDGMCDAMMFRDVVALERGDLPGARAIVEEVAAFAREHNLRQLPQALVNLADIAIAQGDLMHARRLCDEALAASEGPESIGGTIALINLAEIANTQARPDEGAALGRQALIAAWNRGDLMTAVWAAIVTTWSLAELGELERAGRLLGATSMFVEKSGASRQRTERVSEERTLQALGGQLDDDQMQALLAQGREMPIETAVLDASRGPQYSSWRRTHIGSEASSARPLDVRSSRP